jgi:hypothetical protein
LENAELIGDLASSVVQGTETLDLRKVFPRR